MKKKIVIVGGGAAGFFLAANLPYSPHYTVTIVEKSARPLQKVKISGGGRCNVTHACFDSKELVSFYPRGNKELLSVFHQFQPADTMQWFEDRNVSLTIEQDNRVFPKSNDSQSVIECFLQETKKNNVEVLYNTSVRSIQQNDNRFTLKTQDKILYADILVLTTGSAPALWQIIEQLGHTIVKPVPSLFTLQIEDFPYKELMGTSFDNAIVSLVGCKCLSKQQGDLLITHWGISGPAVLKLSAYGARWIAENNYSFKININWLGISKIDAVTVLNHTKNDFAKKHLYQFSPLEVTKRFWQKVIQESQIPETLTYANLSKEQVLAVATQLTDYTVNVTGKSTYKDEFVTAGGVSLKEIDFKTMQSKLIPNLYFAGEVLDIDAVTGGFNFQACWSEAYIISKALEEIKA